MKFSHEDKLGIGMIIFSILIVVGAVIFSTAARNINSDSSTSQVDCPPRPLPTAEELAIYPRQDISERLIANFRQTEEHDGKVVTKIETEAFCIFMFGEVVFGLLNQDYVDLDGDTARSILQSWAEEQQIPRRDICQVIWIGTPNPCVDDRNNPDQDKPGEQPEGDTGLA